MPIDYRPVFNGQFINWNEEKKFGFIAASDHKKGNIEVYAHVSGRIGARQTNSILGKRCLFALGLDPHRYSKGGKEPSAVAWILEDDAGAFRRYLQLREEYLADPHNLQNFIKAEWYVSLWTKQEKCHPRCKLELDEQLLRAIEKHEANIDSAIKLQKWLMAKVESPYFAINKEEQNAVNLKSWKAATKHGGEFFRTLGLAEFLKLCKENLITEDISYAILPDLLKANSVAIDIESDGKEIYQLGYATEAGSRLLSPSGIGRKTLAFRRRL